MKNTLNLITCAMFGASALVSTQAFAEDDFLTPKLDFRLRYENSDRDNGLSNGSGLTLRTTLSVKSKEVNGFSGYLEFEDVRTVLGVDDFNDTLGRNPDRNVIADPSTTEWDQGYIQYKTDTLTARVGRQLITLDDHRFIGSVAWRQDKQTFDAGTIKYSPIKDLDIFGAYISKRNRIFAEERDLDSNDFLFNASYKTSVGKIVAYSYLLEVDDTDQNRDTYGAYFQGAQPVGDIKVDYHVEYASQSFDTPTGDFDADYLRLIGGVTFSGLNAKVGYEVLGSDDSQYGFATPLATLHKFNGWTDQFLTTPTVGLQDLYFQVGGAAAGGKWLVRYHDYTADDSTATLDDLGSEIEGQFTKTFKNGIYSGIKAAFYSQGDEESNVDETIFWVWVGKTF